MLLQPWLVVLCVVELVVLVMVVLVVEVEVEVVVVDVSINCPIMIDSSGSLGPCLSHIIIVYEAAFSCKSDCTPMVYGSSLDGTVSWYAHTGTLADVGSQTKSLAKISKSRQVCTPNVH